MRDFYDQWMYIKYDDVREEYQQNPEHFMALVVGIDEKTFHYINQQNETAIDEKSFWQGKAAFYASNIWDIPMRMSKIRK